MNAHFELSFFLLFDGVSDSGEEKMSFIRTVYELGGVMFLLRDDDVTVIRLLAQ